MVIGGAEIFRAALPFADRIYLTLVHGSPDGDTRLEPFDPQAWRETAREAYATEPRTTNFLPISSCWIVTVNAAPGTGADACRQSPYTQSRRALFARDPGGAL